MNETKAFKAIAAMSLNRVIGAGNRIPWHLPEEFRWFKKTTVGQIIVMGRKTFESIGKPLPNRTMIVLTRSAVPIQGLEIASELDQIDPANPAFKGRDVFICGGAQIYQLALPRCSDLYLTQVNRIVDGDAFFPAFEDAFELVEEVMARPEFKVLHFRRTCSASAWKEPTVQPERPKQDYASEPSAHTAVEEAVARSKDDAPWERTLRCQDLSERPVWSNRSQPGNR
jgi:dihydrofolate reductase